MNNWFFADNSFGSEEGFNSQQLDFFKIEAFNKLAREVIQNSLDASVNENGSIVKVSFDRFDLPSDDFPGRDALLKHMNNSMERCNREKERGFFKKSKRILESSKVSFLKISDYGTTGLRGIGDKDSEWNSLVNASGQSVKSNSGAGGSYGIGKNAPFVLSDLRTVFYGTKNKEGKNGFQGVAKLVTHKGISNDKDVRATGFYYDVDSHGPVTDYLNKVSSEFNRTEVGTDVFIAGFRKSKVWEKEIIKSVVSDFFVAILNDKLEVSVGKNVINKKSIKSYLDNYVTQKGYSDKVAREFFETYSSQQPIEIPVSNLGKINLYLKEDPTFSNRVAMFRKTGMKIYDLNRLPSVINFSGVATIESNKLNSFLRELEPPTHDRWVPELADSKVKSEAEDVLKKIKQGILEEITKLAKDSIKDREIIRLDTLSDQNEKEQIIDSENSERSFEFSKAMINGFKEPEVTSNRKKREPRKHTGKRNNGNKKSVKPGQVKNNNILSFSKFRIIEIGSGEYMIKMLVNKSFVGKLEVYVIGQNRKLFNEKVVSARISNSNTNLKVTGNIIGPVEIEKNIEFILNVNIPSAPHVSLEVSAYVEE